LGGRKGIRLVKSMGRWRWALLSPVGVVPSQMVNVSASVNLPLYLYIQKFCLSPAHPGGPGKGAIKRLWYTGQPALAGTPVKNLRMLLEQSFTARMPLPMATSGFGLGRRCWSYPQ